MPDEFVANKLNRGDVASGSGLENDVLNGVLEKTPTFL
jgi:hypothetical protein